MVQHPMPTNTTTMRQQADRGPFLNTWVASVLGCEGRRAVGQKRAGLRLL